MSAEDTAARELQADYDLAQAFRDEPRGISLACSLILALLDENSGPLCTALAVVVYKDVLMRFARETFEPPKEGSEDPLRDALASDVLLNLVRKAKTGKMKQKFTSKELDDVDKKHVTLRQALFRATYSGLGVTLECYRYPILNRLNGLKVMADALLLQSLQKPKAPSEDWEDGDHLFGRKAFYEHFGTSMNSQIARHIREMKVSAGLYGSDLHFPSDRSGTTMALAFLHMKHYGLHAIYDDNISDPPQPYGGQTPKSPGGVDKVGKEHRRAEFFRDDVLDQANMDLRPLLSETILTREAIGEFALNRLSRAQESFSMGDAYYENIDYLNYLNDDFNDRSIHYYHASTMAEADLSEILALLVKEGISIRQPKDL